MESCSRKVRIEMNPASTVVSVTSTDTDLDLHGERDRLPHDAFAGTGTIAADVCPRSATDPYLGDLVQPPIVTTGRRCADAVRVELGLVGCLATSYRSAELEWLKLAWGDGYEDIAMDGDRWRARRRDGDGGVFNAATAGGLDAALRADWSHREAE